MSNLDMENYEMRPCASWTEDCQGKKDYDGRLLDISTRYWPGSEGGGTMTFDTKTSELGTLPYGKKPSAHSSIVLRFGKPDENGYGDYLVWRDARFEADTEEEVKMQVEAWAAKQMANVIELLGGETAFRGDMSEMVERVAKVIAVFGWHGDVDYTAIAHAAIAAMRVPTQAMIDKACEDIYMMTPDVCWRTMIDAALTDRKTKQ